MRVLLQRRKLQTQQNAAICTIAAYLLCNNKVVRLSFQDRVPVDIDALSQLFGCGRTGGTEESSSYSVDGSFSDWAEILCDYVTKTGSPGSVFDRNVEVM